MGSSIVMVLTAAVAQAPAPAPKVEAKPAAAEAAAAKLKDARAALAERPLCRGRGSPDGDRGRGEERAGGIESRAQGRAGSEQGRVPGQPGRIRQGDRRPQGGGGRASPRTPTCRLGWPSLYLTRGDWEAAEAAMRQAEKLDPDHLLARWVEGRLLELRGELEKAVAAWKWFVDRYNEKRAEIVTSAEALLLVGQAAERYYRASARGEELSDSLNDVINDIYEAALRVDPNCWQAPLLEGRLFLSGYNERSATRELARAQQINPLAPEVLVTLGQADLQGYRLAAGRSKAERALTINPHYAPAYVLLADLNISDERFDDAKAAAVKAVAENPRDEDALARLAASCRLLVDPVGAAAAELAALANNPRPATFYAALGERLADRRKYHSAERAFLLAVAADPTRADAPIGLGMLYMQVGRETEAKSLFDAAFDADPFNVRADNMIKVLRHMAGYSSIDSPHFSVVVDPTQDELLGRYMSRYLESIYPTLTTRFGYAPPGRTKIEILKNHQWFSGRTIGLPFVPTVGACTGRVVALASPKATRMPFNWARVLTHELVHVITLQQTEFNIPHWYTEALAVESEGFPRPQEWNRHAPGARAQAQQALEPRHDQPRLHPAQRARRPPDGLLPGPALCPLHAQAVRRRRLDQDAHGLPPRTHDRPGDRRLLPRRQGRLREGLSVLSRRGDQDDPHPRQRGEADQVLAARAPAQGEARRSRLERADGLRTFRPPRLQGGPAVCREGTRAQAAPSAGQLRQGPALGDDRRRRRPRSRSSSRRSTPSSPTSG